MVTIGFIGAGIVGTALAVRLSQKGYPVVAVSSRSFSSAEKLAKAVNGCRPYPEAQKVAEAAELIFVTTPDDAIAPVVAQLKWRAGQSVVHCSGAASLDILAPAKQAGVQVGAFHPLQTFASVAYAIENLPGSTFALEAEEPLLSLLQQLAGSLEGHWVQLKAGDKVLYHTAAVFACNYVVTLVGLAIRLWQTLGIPQREATQALLPLLRGTINNIGNVGLPNCLTGPIARGDLGTIQKHLAALEKTAPSLLHIYQELGLQTIPIALAKGKINEQRAKEMQTLLGGKL